MKRAVVKNLLYLLGFLLLIIFIQAGAENIAKDYKFVFNSEKARAEIAEIKFVNNNKHYYCYVFYRYEVGVYEYFGKIKVVLSSDSVTKDDGFNKKCEVYQESEYIDIYYLRDSPESSSHYLRLHGMIESIFILVFICSLLFPLYLKKNRHSICFEEN